MDYRIETSKGFRMLLKKTRFKQGSEITKPQFIPCEGQPAAADILAERITA